MKRNWRACSVAAAAAATDALATCRRLAGKINMLAHRGMNGITAGIHRIVREMGALPRLHANRGTAAGQQRQRGGESTKEKTEDRFHGVEIFSASSDSIS